MTGPGKPPQEDYPPRTPPQRGARLSPPSSRLAPHRGIHTRPPPTPSPGGGQQGQTLVPTETRASTGPVPPCPHHGHANPLSRPGAPLPFPLSPHVLHPPFIPLCIAPSFPSPLHPSVPPSLSPSIPLSVPPSTPPSLYPSLSPRSLPPFDNQCRSRPGAPGPEEPCGAVPHPRGLHTHGHVNGGGRGCRAGGRAPSAASPARPSPARSAAGTARDSPAPSGEGTRPPRRAGHGPVQAVIGTGEGSGDSGTALATGAAPTVPRPGGSACHASLPQIRGSRDAVPWLSRDCGPLCAPGCHEPLPSRAPGAIPGDPVTPLPRAPRAVPGDPRLSPAPAPSVRPELSRAIPGYSGTCSSLRREVSRAVPGCPRRCR